MDNPSDTLLGFYLSHLGRFDLRLHSTNRLFAIVNGGAEVRTAGHTIIIRQMPFPQEWLSSDEVEAATAWLFYVSKHNTSEEQLTFSVELQPETDLIGEASTGQWLFAAEFENGTRQLHIGTEDEEAMAQRAYAEDGMPSRLIPLLNSSETALSTLSSDNRGVRTQIPQLQVGEQFYFHYILAENPYREAADYPGEMDIATWAAVNQPKHRLEKAWQEHTKKLRL